MDHREVGRYWEGNAEAWTQLSRQGCDVYRDYLNTPAFLGMLPDVSGLRGVDIGCGEGHNTRLLAGRGARMTAFDICPTFVRHAREREAEEPLGIEYQVASAVEAPFADATFDFATGFMSFMDIPETGRVIAEAYRILKPGGFLQFSISHPCFVTPKWRWIRDEQGRRVAMTCGDYFDARQGDVEDWIFSAANAEQRAEWPKFKIPRFLRILSEWVNLLVDVGFRIERMVEPTADDEMVRRCPDVDDTRIVGYFLITRCRKG